MPSNSALKGYLLEEILAYLIKNTGYRLLVDPSQDPRELGRRGNGLVVQGRGGVHQADVLGQLLWIPAFTFPIRLFVEAKCTTEKAGLPIIRNAVGVVDDINQNYAPIHQGSDRLIKRYSYHYAVFSTAGFSNGAVDYAMAHQISLIDLSGPDFEDLRQFADRLAALIENQMSRGNPSGLTRQKNLINRLRKHLRQALGTWPEGVSEPESTYNAIRNQQEFFLNDFYFLDDELLTGVNQISEMFVGMASGPFLLTLKPEDPQQFLRYLEEYPAHRVIITWRRSNRDGRQWMIRPVGNRQAYTLSFGLPKRLGDWIFSNDSGATRRALDVKAGFLKEIMIYRYINGRDYLYRLSYDPDETRRFTSE